MSTLSSEAEALARRAGQECKALRDLIAAQTTTITALTARVTELEESGGGGGGTAINFSGGVASAEDNGTTFYWLASTTPPDT